MKNQTKIYFILCITFVLLNNRIYANNDSLLINNDSLSETLIVDSCLEVITDNSATITKQLTLPKSKKTKVKPITITNNKPDGFGDFLNDIWDIVSAPFKPVWGYYEEENMNNEGPYFMFNRMENNNFKNK